MSPYLWNMLGVCCVCGYQVEEGGDDDTASAMALLRTLKRGSASTSFSQLPPSLNQASAASQDTSARAGASQP